MKQFQIALDVLSTKSAMDILSEVSDYIDIIELGTPLMIAEGSYIIETVKKKYPNKIVLADIKVMDGGNIIPRIAFEKGADIVSVLAASNDQTIISTIECAKEFGKSILVDMCAIKNMSERGKQIEKMKPEYICVHVGYDVQASGANPVEELEKLNEVNLKKAIAGGIKLSNFEEAVKSEANVIIVGGGVYNQSSMKDVAKQMYEIIKKYN